MVSLLQRCPRDVPLSWLPSTPMKGPASKSTYLLYCRLVVARATFKGRRLTGYEKNKMLMGAKRRGISVEVRALILVYELR